MTRPVAAPGLPTTSRLRHRRTDGTRGRPSTRTTRTLVIWGLVLGVWLTPAANRVAAQSSTARSAPAPAVATPSAAAPPGRDVPARGESAAPLRSPSTAPFWRQVHSPRIARARVLLRHGLERYHEYWEARRHGLGSAQQRALLEGALLRFRRAHQFAGGEPEPLLWLARATSLWERRRQDGSVERRDAQARALFEALRLIDPNYEARDVAFSLGIIYTREQRFRAAAAEYERAVGSSLAEDDGVVETSNWAEVTMMSGDLERAIDLFERALLLARRVGANLALTTFGLAVALDRIGDRAEARERAREAVNMSGGTLAELYDDGVFFEPEYEIHYYEGLGYEALGYVDQEPAALEQALAAFRLYLRRGGDRSPWADQARTHVESLEAAVASRGGGSAPR